MTIQTFKGVQNQELVLKADYDKLAAECASLKAENCIQDFIITAVKDLVRESDGVIGWHLNGDVASWDEVLPELSHSETTATDAAIAEFRAQGVDALASRRKAAAYVAMNHNDKGNFEALMDESARAEMFAAELRAGVKG